MNLYLIRHGNAEKAGLNKSDFERELTEEGRQKLERAVKYWKNLIPEFDFIITSPLIRAKQTAEIIFKSFNSKHEIIIENTLKNGSETADILNIVNSLNGDNIALVGHQPDFSYHLSNLISSGSASLDFKKGAIAEVSFDGKAKLNRGMLEFLIPTGAFK